MANKPAVQSASNRKFQFSNRLKFTMKRRKVKGLLENLDQYNARLDGLVQKAERIEGDRYQTHKKLRFTEPWDTVRKNARMLYRALSQSWCDSHSSHSVGLLLEQRIVRKKRPNRDKGVIPRPQENCFALCLFHDACGGTGLDAEFRLLQKAARLVSVCISTEVWLTRGKGPILKVPFEWLSLPQNTRSRTLTMMKRPSWQKFPISAQF